MNTILNKYNWPLRTSAFATLNAIEDLAGFSLPNDYKEFLLQYTGYETFIGPEFIKLWDADEIVTYNEEYGISQSLINTLAIGSNGGAEFIAIVKDNAGFKIVLSPFIDLDEEFHVTIGSSFTNFLERLDNGAAWLIKK